jgi:hypothetical protein
MIVFSRCNVFQQQWQRPACLSLPVKRHLRSACLDQGPYRGNDTTIEYHFDVVNIHYWRRSRSYTVLHRVDHMISEERKRRKRYIFMTCTIRFSKQNYMQGIESNENTIACKKSSRALRTCPPPVRSRAPPGDVEPRSQLPSEPRCCSGHGTR